MHTHGKVQRQNKPHKLTMGLQKVRRSRSGRQVEMKCDRQIGGRKHVRKREKTRATER